MKYFLNKKLVFLVCWVLSLGLLTACDDEDESSPNNGQIALLSFGPTGAKHGEQIQFIGLNLDKVEAIELPRVTVPKAQFVNQTSELITLVVPDEATAGKVVLKSSAGDVTSKTVLNFEVPVSITSFTQEARPGANITVTGNKLNWVEGVIFGDSKDTITTFVNQTLTELTLTVPMDAKNGVLTFITGGTEPLVITPEQELIVTLPKVTALAPNPLKHGENVTLTGTDLDLVKEVIFTAVGEAKVTSFVSQNATELVITVPDNAKKGILTLVVPSLVEVTTPIELDIILPAITSVAPTPVEIGANLTVNGTNLDLVKTITFGGGIATSTFVSQSATKMVVAVPANAKKGALKLTTHRNFDVITNKEVQIKGDTGPNIAKFIFEEALSTDWEKWGGWGTTTQDLENAEQVSRGSKAIKLSFNDAYGALQLHPKNANAFNGFTHLVLYVRGGTKDCRLAVQVKNAAGTSSSDAPFDVKLGEYKLVEIPISALGDVSGGVAEVYIKNYGENPNTVYIDDLGLR
ncbi:hypothetical protein AHMF7605_14995 [Adhaeribacter arboris]|uniref:IPT/TIG domain-containing protein n=1 Tax=Adhaeribacter arboris TaxID=2072846 RepID=A0A2T2YGT6_9BACT|nr:IPT/TIG domain-containing protein [Adhaeribacter arboris]PSR54719.1 hypothetical protein AHMF7605_14995 [Adhaeribacter arboris]